MTGQPSEDVSFGVDAGRYDRARPGYPRQLVDDLLAGRAGEASDVSAVLEVGCGTGIASRLFAARGCRILGVEPDERMACRARTRGIDVAVARFEDWDPAGQVFDLLISAQAWHWVDRAIGAAKAGRVVRAGGRVALFWNVLEPPSQLLCALELTYQRLAPDLIGQLQLSGNPPPVLERSARALDATKLFTPTVTRTYPWFRQYTAAEWIDMLRTHSDFRGMAPARREYLMAAITQDIERVGGTVNPLIRTHMITAERHT